MREGDRTPWGRAQDITTIAPGVEFVSTAGHGGLKLDRRQNARVPVAVRKRGGFYEEDCDYAIVAAALPEIRSAMHIDNSTIVQSLAAYNRPAYQLFVSLGLVTPTAESESVRLRREAEEARRKHAVDNNLPIRCSALSTDDGRVHVLFRVPGETECIGFYMSSDAYHADVPEPPTPDDYRRHGVLEPAPADFV